MGSKRVNTLRVIRDTTRMLKSRGETNRRATCKPVAVANRGTVFCAARYMAHALGWDGVHAWRPSGKSVSSPWSYPCWLKRAPDRVMTMSGCKRSSCVLRKVIELGQRSIFRPCQAIQYRRRQRRMTRSVFLYTRCLTQGAGGTPLAASWIWPGSRTRSATSFQGRQ